MPKTSSDVAPLARLGPPVSYAVSTVLRGPRAYGVQPRTPARSVMLLVFADGWVVASVAACLSAPARIRHKPDPAQAPTGRPIIITCTSKPGERSHCPADTSKGVVLGEIARRSALPARQVVGLRRPRASGCRTGAAPSSSSAGAARGSGGGGDEEEAPRVHPERRVPARTTARRARSTCGSSATCAT